VSGPLSEPFDFVHEFSRALYDLGDARRVVPEVHGQRPERPVRRLATGPCRWALGGTVRRLIHNQFCNERKRARKRLGSSSTGGKRRPSLAPVVTASRRKEDADREGSGMA
jgi:hypothetical protein